MAEVGSYHKEWLTHADRMREMLADHLDEFDYDSGTILDWGCSFGVSTQEIADLFGGKMRVIGMDISLDRLLGTDKSVELMETVRPKELEALLEKELPTHFVAGDGYEPPFAKESFEIIFMMNNLSELLRRAKLSRDELKSILEANLSLVKDGGVLVIGRYTGLVNFLLIIKKDSEHAFSMKKIFEVDEEYEKESKSEHELIEAQVEEAIESINSDMY